MTDARQGDQRAGLEKDPDEWVTGDEPMTGAQQSYLETLARQAGEDLSTENLTKAEASRKIDELRKKTGLDSTDSGGSPAGG